MPILYNAGRHLAERKNRSRVVGGTQQREKASWLEGVLRQAIREFRDVPPNKESSEARRLVSQLIGAGIHRSPEGLLVEIFGPVVADRSAEIDNLFVVQARYLEGEREGHVFRISIFTEDGYIKAYQRVEA